MSLAQCTIKNLVARTPLPGENRAVRRKFKHFQILAPTARPGTTRHTAAHGAPDAWRARWRRQYRVDEFEFAYACTHAREFLRPVRRARLALYKHRRCASRRVCASFRDDDDRAARIRAHRRRDECKIHDPRSVVVRFELAGRCARDEGVWIDDFKARDGQGCARARKA